MTAVPLALKVQFLALCHWARVLLKNRSILVLLSGHRYRILVTARQLPWCAARMCSLSSPLLSSIKISRPTLSELIREPGWIHAAGRMFRKVFLPFSGPSIASHRLVWMQRLVVRPLRHRADNTAPDGILLWPVTPRSQGQCKVKRGQSLRTPPGVPLSSEGRVAR